MASGSGMTRQVFRLAYAWFVSVILFQPAKGQIFFSTNPDYIKSKSEGNNLASRFESDYPDTTVFYRHHFYPRNFLGNLGLPQAPYQLRYGSAPLGFRFFEPRYDNDRFYTNNVTYHRSSGPFASLTGITGSAQLQYFHAFFTQTFRNQLNISLRFKRYTSLGFYRRQQSFTNNFFLSSNYDRQGKRLGYYLYIINNNNRHAENGGIRDTLLTDSTVVLQKALLQVRYNSAAWENRGSTFMLNPFLHLVGKDSARFKATLQLKSSFQGALFRYTDQAPSDPGVFDINFDSLRTNDSSRHRKFSNEAALVLLTPRRGSGLKFGVRHETNWLYQIERSRINNMMLVAAAHTGRQLDSAGRELRLEASAEQVITGFNGGDYRFEGNLAYGKRSLRRATIAALFESRRPDYYYLNWRTNNFLWNNLSFAPRQMMQADLTLNLTRKITLAAFYETVNGELYFDEEAIPQQLPAGEMVSNTGLRLSVEHVFFRRLGVYASYRYQTTSQPDIVRIPPHHILARLFSQNLFFRGRLQLQLGVQGEMFAAFSPYAYMPASQAFYLQQKISTEPYPFVDVYLNARIRPVTVFFKLENALERFVPPTHYLLPAHYQPSRAFRMGINWVFFD